MARAAIPAVSVRSMVLPRDTGTPPLFMTKEASSSENPPSGPMMTATLAGFLSHLTKSLRASFMVTPLRFHRGKAQDQNLRSSLQPLQALQALPPFGILPLLHCFTASAAILFHRSPFFPEVAPFRCDDSVRKQRYYPSHSQLGCLLHNCVHLALLWYSLKEGDVRIRL